jgi:hypothetical protein
VPPQRSIILEAELGKRASGELVGLMLAGLSKLNDLLRDQLGHPIFRGHGELKLGAQASKAPCMAWLESESTGLITTELLDRQTSA